jgi:Na+/H+-dicarboxylate symporter
MSRASPAKRVLHPFFTTLFSLLIIIATIGSAGTAPVPASGLVLIVTAYNTVFGTTGIPEGFSFVVAIDWFLDRLITVVNVTGDASVCGMIAKLCPMDDELLPYDETQKYIEDESEESENNSSPVSTEEEPVEASEHLSANLGTDDHMA